MSIVAEDLPAAARALLSGDTKVLKVLAEHEQIIETLCPEIGQLATWQNISPSV